VPRNPPPQLTEAARGWGIFNAHAGDDRTREDQIRGWGIFRAHTLGKMNAR
jgi:hypothetical protein